MSHTILVIDNSGSMRNEDVFEEGTRNYISRHQATFNALAKGLFIPQLQAGVGPRDVVTIIKLGEDGEVVVSRVPFAEAAKTCGQLVHSMTPRSHGNYLPALGTLGRVLRASNRDQASGPTNVLFFSDGKPSDSTPPGHGTPKEKLLGGIVRKTLEACPHDVPLLKLHTVGFGNDDFSILRAMASALPADAGTFHNSGLSLHALTRTLSTFSVSVSESRLTSSAGPARELRPVHKSAHPQTWVTHRGASVLHAPDGLDARWETLGRFDVRITEAAFDSGGERNVFKLQFDFPGEWVAKENKHIERTGLKELDFHKRNLVTQAVARQWGLQFNRAVANCRCHVELPKISVSKCYLLSLASGRLLFAEPFYQGTFTKWNSNFGSVTNKSVMGGIREEDEDDDWDDSYFLRPKIDDVPQAFSHYTYHASNRTRLVCDIQGVFQSSQFKLVDPVIHSNEGEKAKFGRTDRGQQGMDDFFKSHTCNGLCKLLHLPHNRAFEPHVASGLQTSRSMATSEFSVVKTNHLAQRQNERLIPTRELQSAVKHGEKLPAPGGRVIHRSDDIEYITDMTGRIGITSYRPARFVPNLR